MTTMQHKKPGKALVKWDEELAKLAKDSTKGMNLPTAKFISIRGGKLSFGGADVPGNELRAVVLGWIYENQYYDQDFDPNVPSSPACYAFGDGQEEMVPHEKASDKQNEDCATCPMNEWDSGARGKGKACKNVLRLAVIAESDLEDLSSAEIVYMKIPVMSVNNFLVYAKRKISETLKRPYWAVVTNISVTPDDRSQYKVLFSLGDKIENSKLFGSLKELCGKTMEGIAFPYPEAMARPKLKGKRGTNKPPAKAQKFARR